MKNHFFFFFALSIIVISVSASSSYTVYSDTQCANQISSGSGISATTQSQSGNTVTQTGCFTVSGVNGVQGGVITCLSGQVNSNSLLLYNNNNNCATNPTSVVYEYLGGGSYTGGCVASSTGGATSAKWTCNSGFTVYTTSIPLMLLLALLAILAM